jgi:hypothetical protein
MNANDDRSTECPDFECRHWSEAKGHFQPASDGQHHCIPIFKNERQKWSTNLGCTRLRADATTSLNFKPLIKYWIASRRDPPGKAIEDCYRSAVVDLVLND